MGWFNKSTGSRGKVLFQHVLQLQTCAIGSGSTSVLQFDDVKVEVMVFMHVDDIFAHAQAAKETLTAELRDNLK